MMKKVLKLVVALCLLIAVSATAVPAAATAAGGAKASDIKPNTVKTGSEKISQFPVHKVSYSKSDLVNAEKNQYYGKVVRIQIPAKGDVYFDFTGTPVVSGMTNIRLYSNVSCTSLVPGGSELVMDSSDVDTLRVSCPKKGTYYLAFLADSGAYSKLATDSFSFRCYFYSAANRTLKSGAWTASAEYDGAYRYYKMSLAKAGHVKIQSNADYYFAICNKSKKEKYSSLSFSKDNKRTVSCYLGKGTYYIKTKGSYSGPYKLKYTFSALGKSPYALKDKKTVTVNPDTNKMIHYLKYKATKDGYITLSIPRTQSAYLTLCNSKRKALSGKEEWIYGSDGFDKVVYGVKKGTTYYLKTTSDHNTYKLKVRFTPVTEKSGASRRKAVTLKAGKTIKGTLSAGSSASDWYKIKLPKTKKLVIKVKGNSNDGVTFCIYKSNGKPANEGDSSVIGGAFGGTIKSIGKMPRGTYYIKVAPGTKHSSGYYSLSWK